MFLILKEKFLYILRIEGDLLLYYEIVFGNNEIFMSINSNFL